MPLMRALRTVVSPAFDACDCLGAYWDVDHKVALAAVPM